MAEQVEQLPKWAQEALKTQQEKAKETPENLQRKWDIQLGLKDKKQE